MSESTRRTPQRATTAIRRRPTLITTRCTVDDRSSPFFERLAEEKVSQITETRNNDYSNADVIVSAIVEVVFALNSTIGEYFERPSGNKRVGRNLLEDLGDGNYACRLFLKNPTLPDSFKVQFGPHHGLKPGVAICRMNTAINAEEQTIVRREWRHCLTRDGILSPGVIYPWFTKEILKVLKILNCQESDAYFDISSNEKDPFDGVMFREEGSVVKLLIWQEGNVPNSSKSAHEWRTKPLEITFIPCRRGAGWPGGAMIQHAFPKLKPFVKKGTNTIQRLANLVEDGRGYDLWMLEPSRDREMGVDSYSAMTDGGVSWKISLRPTIRILMGDLVAGVRDPALDRNVDIERIRGVVGFLKDHHNWSAFSDDVIDSAILWTVKKHLLNVRITSDMFVKVLEFLLQVARTQSCPFFLMPNLNIFRIFDSVEARKASADVMHLLTSIAKDDSYFLKYLGYKTKTELREERRRELYSHVTRRKIRSAMALINIRRTDIYK